MIVEVFFMTFGYTVCSLKDGDYTLHTAFHEGNAFFDALQPMSVGRVRKKDGKVVLRYQFVPQLLYVVAEDYKQLQQLQNGVIIDQIDKKKRLVCTLQLLDSGKFAPYTLKSNKRYTKEFVQPTLYEPLDDSLTDLEGWFYAAPLLEDDEPIFTEAFEHVTKQPLSHVIDASLLQKLLKKETTFAETMHHYLLDFRKYAHHASYIVRPIDVATGCEIVVNGYATSNALLVSEKQLLDFLALQKPDIVDARRYQNVQKHIHDAIERHTGPFANKLVLFGDGTKLQACFHVDSTLPLQANAQMDVHFVNAQKTTYGIIDPCFNTMLASVKENEIACNYDVAYINSTHIQAISRVQRVKSRFPIADNVVLLPQTLYMPYYAQLETYDDSMRDELEAQIATQLPLRQSIYYDTLAAFIQETPPIASISARTNLPQTPFYERLAEANIQLNEAQRQAVECVDGPVMILAGAGSGKTTTLISRIAYMVEEQRILPSHILLVTFTKKAATEMTERLAKLSSSALYANITVGTYHAICLRILREQGRDFQVLSSEASKHFRFKMILKKLGLADDYTPEAVINIISKWKNRMLRPIDIKTQAQNVKNASEKTEMFTLHKVYELYEQDKEARNELDFDDFLLEVYYLLLYDDEARAMYQERFRYVLCDEFQDVSTVQYELTRLLAAPHDNLCIVGDDNQTIYTWRAASSSFMLDFDKRYPDAKQIKLETNYRSTADIVGFGNAIIAKNKKQIKKVLNVPAAKRHPVYLHVALAPEHEAELVLNEIQQLHYNGLPYRQMAVLTRSATYIRTLFEHFVLKEIPVIDYTKQGESFYDHDYIKRFIAAMRISLNPNDADAITLLGKLLYMPQHTWQSAIEHAQFVIGDKSLFERVMLQAASQKAQRFQQDAIIRQMNAILRYRHQSPKEVLHDLRTGSVNCERQLEIDAARTKTLHKEELRELFDEFEVSITRFRTIEEFLNFFDYLQQKKRDMERMKNDPTIDAVPIMTIHSAKGLEFEAVFAIGWFEEMLPHFKALGKQNELSDELLTPDEALAEERRLAYVCATRAKERLYVSSVRLYHNKPCKLSRFIRDGSY